MNTAEKTEYRPPTAEHNLGQERLTHEKLRREMAELAFLILVVQAFGGSNSNLLSNRNTQAKGELISMIADSFSNRHQRTAHERPAASYRQSRMETASWHDEQAFAYHSPSVPRPEAQQPDFAPAPSMADKPLGPELPNLAFNDRIRPWDTGSKNPSEADFKAADRANDMYQSALFEAGWRGGEATATQQKAARRSMIRQYHPDLPSTTAGDAEALKMFNANNSRKPSASNQETTRPSSEN